MSTNLISQNDNSNLISVLRETLYPDATEQEAHMILSYCKARHIDPILKPVHLVPMSVKTSKKDSSGKAIYEYRKVVMPGIGLYRIDASRSGQYAGMGEPEFGADVTEKIGNVTVTYPKWCRISVKKIVNGQVFEFTAKEFWKENYATKGRNDNSPNEMWAKRPYGQLAKCAEAQALRKGFPDVVGNDYTKEEMEGKSFPPAELKATTIVPSNVRQIAPAIIDHVPESDDLSLIFIDYLYDLQHAQSIEELKEVYNEVKAKNFHQAPELFKQLVNAKDERKLVLERIAAKLNEEKMVAELDNVDVETGEIK